MPERHGLGGLQMREARHHRAGLGRGLLRQHLHQARELDVDVVDRVADPEPEIGRHLVVARARRVQPPGRLADDLRQPRLDIHVDVFERPRKVEPPAGDFRADLL